MDDNKYTCIMIDVVDSRKLDNRDEVQRYLKYIIEYLNDIFCNSLKKQLMFSAGDEIQGLFNNTLAAYLCARFCLMICFPVKVRVGIGYGTLAYDNDKWRSSELDGEVYHNARYAIENFQNKSSFGIKMNTLSKKDKLLNALLYSSQIIQRQQSVRAHEIKLIAELIFPIYNKEFMRSYLDYEGQLENILEMRSQMQQKVQKFSVAGDRRKFANQIESIYNISNLKYHICDIPIYEVVGESDLIIDNIWKKGMSTVISEVLGTTRQNIDQHIRLGKIQENRCIDFSIAYWLAEEFAHE